jgi:hypothetical protein
MNDLASQRTRFESDAVGAVRLATVPAHPFVIAGLGHGSAVGLGIAQGTLAALLALAAALLGSLGVSAGFILGTAGLVLVVSGVLLVVWSDADDAVRIAATREATDYRSAT